MWLDAGFLLCPRVQSWAPQHPPAPFPYQRGGIAATCQPGAFLLVKGLLEVSAVAQSVTVMSL